MGQVVLIAGLLKVSDQSFSLSLGKTLQASGVRQSAFLKRGSCGRLDDLTPLHLERDFQQIRSKTLKSIYYSNLGYVIIYNTKLLNTRKIHICERSA